MKFKKNLLEMLKKQKRGGTLFCDNCNLSFYYTPKEIQNKSDNICEKCFVPPIKKHKKKKRINKRSPTKELKLKAIEFRREFLNKHGEYCRECKSTNFIQIHHIDENWKNNKEENLQILCKFCHAKKHPKYSNFILSNLAK